MRAIFEPYLVPTNEVHPRVLWSKGPSEVIIITVTTTTTTQLETYERKLVIAHDAGR